MGIKILVISDYNKTLPVRPEAEILLGLHKLGVEIEIMTYDGSVYSKKFKEAGIKVIDFHPEKKLNKAEILKIKQHLIEGKHDILQLFTSKSIVNGIQAARGLPVKVVLYRGYTGNINWWDPSDYLKYLNPRVDKVICNSKGVEQLLHRQLFFKNEKAITINKGHLPEWYNKEKPANLHSLGIPKNAFVISCVANDRTMKGIPYLLKSLNHLEKGLPIHLLLIGKGLDQKKYKKIANNSSYKNQIHFLGFRKDGLSIVAASDIFALASTKGESITKAVIEAMSLGITPVITDIPGNQELVIDGKCGLVVPKKSPKLMGHAFMRLYNDRNTCRQMGENAQQHIEENLHQQKSIKETIKMYEDLTNQTLD